MLSRSVIAFLPRSKCLFISWLQSPSAVILEPKKIKSVSVSIVSPSIYHDVMGQAAMILVFWMLSFKPTFHSRLSLSPRGSLVLLHFLPQGWCHGEPRRQRNGTGRPLSPHKFIKRTTERWANFTKQLLIASWGHQAPRKAAHCLWKEVGQNIKDKKRDKRAGDGDPSREGSPNRGSFQTPGNPPTGGSGGSFRISEGNLTGRKNK